MARELEATIDVRIVHLSGPVLEDGDHIRRWLVADGGWLTGAIGGFKYEVCSRHADPDECPDYCGANLSIYRATLVSADWDDAA